MKKLYWILGSVIVVMAVSILWLIANSLDVNSPRFSLINRNVENRDYTQFSVEFGTLQDIYENEGTVQTTADDLKMYEWDLSGISGTPKFVLYLTEGDRFALNEQIVRIGGVEHRGTTDGKIIEIVSTTTSLKIYYIDYSDHYVKTTLPQSLESYLTAANQAEVYYDGVTYEATIDAIDYQVIGGVIEVRLLVADLHLLPGSSVTVGLVLQEYVNVFYVPTAYIQSDLIGTFIYLLDLDSGDVTKKYVPVTSTLQHYSIITIESFYLSKAFVNYND